MLDQIFSTHDSVCRMPALQRVYSHRNTEIQFFEIRHVETTIVCREATRLETYSDGYLICENYEYFRKPKEVQNFLHDETLVPRPSALCRPARPELQKRKPSNKDFLQKWDAFSLSGTRESWFLETKP